MRALLTLCLATLAACTFDWDHQAPPFPLTGPVPELSSFQQLNMGGAPVGAVSLIVAPDGVPWAEFCEDWDQGSGNSTRGCLQAHLSRLSPAGQAAVDEDFTVDQIAIIGSEVLLAQDDIGSGKRTLTMHVPGDPVSADVTFVVPAGKGHVSGSAIGDVFAYLVEDEATTTFSIFRRDPPFTRTLPLPDGTDPTYSTPTSRSSFLFTADGSQLVTEAPNDHVIVYSTTGDGIVDLGGQQPHFVLDDGLDALVEGAANGLAIVPLDGSAPRTLVGGDCCHAGSGPTVVNEIGFYVGSDGLWQAPLDGSTPPTLVSPNALQFLAQGPAGQIAYSNDALSKYVNDASSGYLGARQIMKRGIGLAFSNDGERLYYLEDAATLDGEGDLTSIGAVSGSPETLAINAVEYAELPDGRLLAIEDAVFTGTFNRLVIIDLAAQTKHWVTPSVAGFLLTPDNKEMVVDVVTSASGYDILRVPVPAP